MSRSGPWQARATFNSSRFYLEQFLAWAASTLPVGARVLDAGAGDCRYAHLFAHTHYLAVDFAQLDNKPYGPLDAIADLVALPFDGAQFDAVICTQVLEHLPQPGRALSEFYRLLRPGGTLWLTAPLYYEEHEAPFDFYRYTRYGLLHLCQKAGFVVEEMAWLEGYWGTFSYQWRGAAYALPWMLPRTIGGRALSLLSLPVLSSWKALLGGAGILAAYLDVWKQDTSRWHCKNYRVVARRPRMAKER